MDFEKQIQTDRESLIQDIMKLVSIDSVEATPDAGTVSYTHLDVYKRQELRYG